MVVKRVTTVLLLYPPICKVVAVKCVCFSLRFVALQIMSGEMGLVEPAPVFFKKISIADTCKHTSVCKNFF